MTEDEFAELRDYAEVHSDPNRGSCIDNGSRPSASLIRKKWLVEVVPGCWSITVDGAEAFFRVVDGKARLTESRS